MTLIELSKLATRALVDMAVNGNLGPGHIWTAINGATKYLIAAAAGDRATSVIAHKRVSTCDSCPCVTYEGKPAVQAKAMYCGKMLTEDDEANTCGCLVGMLVRGKALPGGKTVVASESCPQGRWQRADPADS